MDNIGNFRTDVYPQNRIGTVDIGAVSQSRHTITALLEVDVTEGRIFIQQQKDLGNPISFNSWMVKCISKAIEENKEIQGIRQGKKKIVVFDDVDISIMVERKIKDQLFPLPYVVRKTNEKSIQDISAEIKIAQNQEIHDEGDFVLGDKHSALWMKIYYRLPGFLRRLAWRRIINNPFRAKKGMGTIIVSSVGMMGTIRGWLIPKTVHPISIAIGSIVKKPGLKNGEICVREYLFLSVLFDHDVVDGAPAMRMLAKLTDLVESGYELW